MANNKLSLPQSQAFFALEKSVGVVAGFGSGKTHGALSVAFDRIIEYPEVPLGYAAPTYRDIEDIWYPAIEKHCAKNGFKHWIHKSKHVVYIDGMAPIVCRSLSNPDAIVGFEVGDFLLDEMDILNTVNAMNAWRKCKARCRFKFPKKKIKLPFGGYTKKKRKPNQMFAFTTPEGFKATHKLFKNLDTKLKDSRLIQMSTYSNIKNLPKDYIEELKANYPPELIQAYIMGIFTNLTSGSVYTSFDRDLNSANNVFAVENEPLYIGMDFNIRNMSAVVHVLRDGLPVAVDEFYKVYDTPQMILAIQQRYPKNRVIIYPDASGGYARATSAASVSDVKLLREGGFYVVVDASNPRIKDRINSMNAMFLNALGYRRYRINVNMCKNYVGCLEQQPYGPDGLPDKTGDMDHLPDAGGYFINKAFGITKPSAGSKKRGVA